MKNVVFLGAKKIGYSCLEVLTGWHGHKLNVVGILTNARGTETRALAEEHGIPVIPNLESYVEFEERVDVAISVQYHEILKSRHIAKAADITVNLHMAPLPEYRGCNQFSFAIINDDSEFGTTLHRIDPGVDSGPIIAERRFKIPDDCWVEDLYELTFNHSVELFRSEILKIIGGDYTTTPQDEYLSTRKTSFHLRKEIEDIKQIDLSWPADRIERHVRATSMGGFEPPHTVIAGQQVYLVRKGEKGIR